MQLADDNALRAVDDKRSTLRHHRNLADIDVFIPNGVFIFKSEINMKGGAVSIPILDTVNDVLLREAEGVGNEFQDHLLVETLDREHFVENFLEALVLALVYWDIELQEGFIGVDLNTDQIRYLQHILQFSEIHTFRH